MAPKRSKEILKRWMDLPLPERNQRILALIDRELEISKLISTPCLPELTKVNFVSCKSDKAKELAKVMNTSRKKPSKTRSNAKGCKPKKPKDPVQKTIDSLQGHLRALLKLKPPKYPDYDLFEPSEFIPVPKNWYSLVIQKSKRVKKKTELKRVAKNQDRRDQPKTNNLNNPFNYRYGVKNKNGHQYSGIANGPMSLQHPTPGARKTPATRLPPLCPPSQNKITKARVQNIEHHTVQKARELLVKGPSARTLPPRALQGPLKRTSVSNASLVCAQKTISATSVKSFKSLRNKVNLPPINRASISNIVKSQDQKLTSQRTNSSLKKSASADPCFSRQDNLPNTTRTEIFVSRDVPVYSASNINVCKSITEEPLRQVPDLISQNSSIRSSLKHVIPDLLPLSSAPKNYPTNHTSYNDIIRSVTDSNDCVTSNKIPYITHSISDHTIGGPSSELLPVSSKSEECYANKQTQVDSLWPCGNSLVPSNNRLRFLPKRSVRESTTHQLCGSNLPTSNCDSNLLTEHLAPRYCQRMDRVIHRANRSKIPVIPTIKGSRENKDRPNAVISSTYEQSPSKRHRDSEIQQRYSSTSVRELNNDVHQKKGVVGSLSLPSLTVTETQQQKLSFRYSPSIVKKNAEYHENYKLPRRM